MLRGLNWPLEISGEIYLTVSLWSSKCVNMWSLLLPKVNTLGRLNTGWDQCYRSFSCGKVSCIFITPCLWHWKNFIHPLVKTTCVPWSPKASVWAKYSWTRRRSTLFRHSLCKYWDKEGSQACHQWWLYSCFLPILQASKEGLMQSTITWKSSGELY